MKGELAEAERVLHEALGLAHQSDNRKAIIYTYSMVRPGGLAGVDLAALLLGADPRLSAPG